MKLALIGVGAIGSIIAANLAKNGVQLYVVEKDKEAYQAIKERGIKISGVNGEYVVKKNLQPLVNVEDLPEEIDVAMTTLKLNYVEEVVKKLQVVLQPNFTLISMSNGMMEEKLMKILKPNNILACVVSFGASRIGSAESEQTSHGEMVIGRIEGQKQEIDDEILRMMNFSAPTHWSDNILGYKYTKLLINIAVASSGVVSGLKLGELLMREKSRLAFLTIVSEAVKVAKASGLKLEELNKFNFENLTITPEEVRDSAPSYQRKHEVIKFLGSQYKNLRSSSLASLERGEKTEIDYLNGYVVRKGAEVDVKTPLNKYIVDVVREIEDGKRQPSIAELERFEEKAVELCKKKEFKSIAYISD